MESFDSSVPVNSTFYAHGRRLEVREEKCECTLVGWMHHFRTIQALLALALLKEQVIATVPVERQLTAAGHADAFLRATVGLQFRHTDEGL